MKGSLTLGEIQRHQRLARVLPIAIHAKRNRRRAPQTASKTNNPKKHRRHNPRVPLLRRPPKPHQPNHRAHHHRHHHDQPKLGLVHAIVAPTHPAHHEVRHLARHRGAEHAADERAQVDEPRAERREVVRIVPVDGRHGLRQHDQPADAERVHHRGPQDSGVGEQDEGPYCCFPPLVLVEPAAPGLEGLGVGFRGLRAERGRVDVDVRRGGGGAWEVVESGAGGSGVEVCWIGGHLIVVRWAEMGAWNRAGLGEVSRVEVWMAGFFIFGGWDVECVDVVGAFFLGLGVGIPSWFVASARSCWDAGFPFRLRLIRSRRR